MPSARRLILNLFSIGCAGFNTLLGPARPHSLACTAALQTAAWRRAIVGGQAIGATAASSLACAVLCFLPEALYWSMGRRGRFSADHAASSAGAAGAADAVGALSTASAADSAGAVGNAGAARCELRVTGMGCTACSVKVKRTLQALDGVEGCDVNFEKASATLRLARDGTPSAQAVVVAAAAALEAAGFGAIPMPATAP